MKQKFISLLRKLHLLQLADHAKFLSNVYKFRSRRKIFVQKNPNFIVPPLTLAYDAYGHTNWQTYFNTGLAHAQYLSTIINKHLQGNELKICEWGCGPARVLRHLPDIYRSTSNTFYGYDYNPKTIEWCQQNIKTIKFDLNQLTPPLSADDNSFDCIYAISVFTHLSKEMHFAWMQELRRVVKPGGIMIVTVHGDTARELLLPSEQSIYDSGDVVVRGQIQEGKRCYLAYQPNKFMKDVLFKNLEVVEHLPTSLNKVMTLQDIWVVRNTK